MEEGGGRWCERGRWREEGGRSPVERGQWWKEDDECLLRWRERQGPPDEEEASARRTGVVGPRMAATTASGAGESVRGSADKEALVRRGRGWR